MAPKVMIVGGGVVGSATTYFLALSSPSIQITVIERDPSYARASSALSAAGIRQQFSSPRCVRMSANGVEFLRSIDSRLEVDGIQRVLDFHEAGYLFLADGSHARTLRDNQRLQTELDADIALLERDALKETRLWFRPERNGFICSVAPVPEEDHDELPLHEIDHRFFDEIVWSALASRIPQFEAMRVQSSWSGCYEYNVFDHNAIIGTQLDVENCIFANGFSGHGLQHSPATGRGVNELIAHGKHISLDLSALGWERVLQNHPLVEINVV
jgi:glycine/D-amino acid oxidase-like deaminating enzyme